MNHLLTLTADLKPGEWRLELTEEVDARVWQLLYVSSTRWDPGPGAGPKYLGVILHREPGEVLDLGHGVFRSAVASPSTDRVVREFVGEEPLYRRPLGTRLLLDSRTPGVRLELIPYSVAEDGTLVPLELLVEGPATADEERFAMELVRRGL